MDLRLKILELKNKKYKKNKGFYKIYTFSVTVIQI